MDGFHSDFPTWCASYRKAAIPYDATTRVFVLGEGNSSGKAAVKLIKTCLPCGGHVPETSLAVASNSP